MKKFMALLLTVILALPFAGCKKDDKDSSGSDSTSVSESDSSQDPIVSEQKKTLLFEIDEGMCGVEFVSGCKKADGSYDFERMDLIMNNVYDGIKDLAPLYTPAAHIYFNWYYDARGWQGKDPSDPINRWDPALIYALDFFREKGVPVYFEWMSSGNYTNQNGELGTLPLVDIYLGTAGKGPREVKGISADIAAVKALHAAYPDVFLGVRFHELIGTHNGGVQGNPHCYTIEEQDVYALIDACADMGIELVWSDHSWSEMYSINTFWQERVAYAEEKLGNKLVIMWANNAGGYLVDYLNYSLYSRFRSDFPTASLGFSAQNWLLSSYYLLGNTSEPVTGPGECDTPVELTAGITLAAFERGASIVQYEASYQFFNWPRTLYVYDALGQGGNQPGKGYLMSGYRAPSSQIEGEDCDYSARVELKRLVRILNSGSMQFANVADFYDTSMSRIMAKTIQDPAKTYSQVTVAATSADGKAYYFDHYNNDPATWLNQNEDRFTSNVINSGVIASGRVLCNDHAYDEIVTVVQENGRKIGYFYNARSCLLSRNTTIFADNEDGEFVGFTAVNLIKNRVSSVNMDCDEIVVARRSGDKINLTLYQAMPRTLNAVDKSGNFIYQEVDSQVDSHIVDRMLGGKSLDAENFIGIVGVRDSITLGKTTRLRNIDGLFAVYKTADGIQLKGKKNKGAESVVISIKTDGNVTAVAAGDWDLDILMKDELIVAVEKGGKTVIEGYLFTSDGSVAKLGTTLDLGSASVNNLATYRKAFFLHDSNLDY